LRGRLVRFAGFAAASSSEDSPAEAAALRAGAFLAGALFFAAALFALWSAAGFLPDGEPRPISPDSDAAGDWPVLPLVALGLIAAGGWLYARPRLAPRRPVARRDELGGHLAAMLVLGIVALVVAATNPYALIFLLPSLHAWLWLPHVPRRAFPLRVAVFLLGLAGPALLVASFALRYELGFDAPWYVLALVSVGYVAPPFLLAALVWGAAALQVGALAFGRYAPHPDRDELRRSGGLRSSLRRLAQGRARAQEPELRVVADD
jgi:MFS family permease